MRIAQDGVLGYEAPPWNQGVPEMGRLRFSRPSGTLEEKGVAATQHFVLGYHQSFLRNSEFDLQSPLTTQRYSWVAGEARARFICDICG